jgi:cystathionine beta-lyase/cystathionine gamma-synthase
MYTRYGNPTVEAVEDQLARQDGAEKSLLFASGMAAISSACFTLLSRGDEMISSFPVYGGTAGLFDRLSGKLGVKIRYFPADDTARMKRAITPKTRLIYLESPTNPNLRLVDLEKAGIIAGKSGAISIIDSTFATPINQKPLEYGIDAVLHSATKYLGGHSDMMGGVLSGSNDLIERVWETRKFLGGCADPGQAFLLERGLKTLKMRMETHNRNALAVAMFLENLKRLKKVIYPGLKSHPQYSKGCGGIVSFDLGSKTRAARFVDSLKVIKNAASLGGTESLVSIPIWTSHYGFDKNRLARFGVTPGMVRLSIGLEDESVLIDDIKRALKRIGFL